MMIGIDASAAQGLVPFGTFECDFLIHKAQQGNDGFDPMFHKNVAAATALGILSFAYFFAYPLPHLSARTQARMFIDSIKGTPCEGLPVFLDLEWPAIADWLRWNCTAEQIAAWCEELCEAIEEMTGRTPVIYTYPDWWRCIGRPSWAKRYPLWIASYEKEPLIPAPWDSWLFWQHDGNGGAKLPNGVDCDFNRFNGTRDDLSAFMRGPSRELPFDIVHPEVIE